MAILKRASSQALLLAGLMLAGCAVDGGDNIFTTGSLTGGQQASAEQKSDPACVTLASRIETLRKEGIQDKIEKAAAKRYKMTQADLGKADQLNKANAEFQARCSRHAEADHGRGRDAGSARGCGEGGAEEGGQGRLHADAVTGP